MAIQRQISIGADPELFLKDPKTGQFISAHDLLPGTKQQPFQLDNGIGIQVDGVAAEFNIPPSLTSDAFVAANTRAVESIRKWKTVVERGLDVVVTPTAVFEKGYWDNLPDDPKELGCNPDWNAWTGQVNPKPDAHLTTMRTASGHIHVGWTKDEDPFDPVHFQDCCIVAKQLDYHLGVYSLMWDQDNDRRTLYGKAGAFRPKSYGCEYRTLSNRWLSDPRLMEWVFYASQMAMKHVFDGRIMEDDYKDLAQKVINEGIDWWNIRGHRFGTLNLATNLRNPPIDLPPPKNPKLPKRKVAKHKYVVNEAESILTNTPDVVQPFTVTNFVQWVPVTN